ncbi:transcriptional regulator, TetR family [Saccharopolyspora kobensis]|uniref:Transcriptional regulator, TetR family n=1 Tax=Saccharopolyspora kobensis TaxID=146035 RepID=A0A1H6AME9_9PSEU|nr:TetR/AcrR family transcriptional regulator [Saccharopolyspora kobensis]SEG48946.1 transcriptional regulator, TetR family [Saccharopolyspora kobensis]SFE58668.1 transcriptional regulator, TetR family [Saccharopolyspora kobensis]
MRAQAKKTEAAEVVDTRTRIVRATALFLQRQGYEGTSIKRIGAEAGVTPGSVYHFFPGGKEQLAAEALRYGAEEFTELLRSGLDSTPDPADAVAACALLLADSLRESEWTDGCPVAAAALETIGASPEIQRASDESLQHWQSLLANKLTSGGIAEEPARALACTIISTMEGAELLCRVSASDQPLRTAAQHLAQLVRLQERSTGAE